MAVPPLSRRDKLPLSKRAVMERLPIHHDPGMWKPDELMEVFRTPKLLEMLRADPVQVKLPDGTEISRFEAGIRALQKAGIRMRDLMPRGPEKWLEHGTFALTWGGDALGFYRTREHAERAKNRVISDFAKGIAPAGMPGILGAAEHLVAETAIQEYWPDHPEEDYDENNRVVWQNPDGSEASRKDVRRYESIQQHAWSRTTRELEGFRHDTMGAPMRKRLAEANTKVVRIPKQLADSDYSEGDEPLEIDRAKAKRLEADPEIEEALEKEWPGTAWDRDKEIYRPMIDTVKKRIKALEEGVDPSKLSNDGALLPRHAATRLFPISKQAAHPYRADPKEMAREAHRRLRELATALGAPAHSGWWFGRDIEDLYVWIAVNAPQQESAARHLAIEAGSSDKRLEKHLRGELHYYERFGLHSWEPDPAVLERDIMELPKNEWYEHFCDDKAAPAGFPISKRAQDPVRRTAESILKIINFIMFRVPQKDKTRFLQRIRGKIMRIPAGQVSIKKLPQTAAIGQAISLTKNILSGLNPFFVKRVIDELANMMLMQTPEPKRPTPLPPRPPGV